MPFDAGDLGSRLRFASAFVWMHGSSEEAFKLREKLLAAAGAAGACGGANACHIVVVLRSKPLRPIVHDAGRGKVLR